MITIHEFLSMTKNKFSKTPIRFKWVNNDYEWECDGIYFPNNKFVKNNYYGIGFFLLSDDHEKDWWANCGNVKNIWKSPYKKELQPKIQLLDMIHLLMKQE